MNSVKNTQNSQDAQNSQKILNIKKVKIFLKEKEDFPKDQIRLLYTKECDKDKK